VSYYQTEELWGMGKAIVAAARRAAGGDLANVPLDAIPSIVVNRGRPAPEGLDGIVRNLEVAGSTLAAANPAADAAVRRSAREIDMWGAGPRVDLEGWLPHIARDHHAVAARLAATMRATRGVYEWQRRELSDLIDATIAALDAGGRGVSPVIADFHRRLDDIATERDARELRICDALDRIYDAMVPTRRP
jgi:hypothetical protein